MKNMTLAHITEVCGGIYFGPEEKKTAEVTDIVTDSRKAGEGSLFVAIPGERVDGHKFIPNVASQGALAVISEQISRNGAATSVPSNFPMNTASTARTTAAASSASRSGACKPPPHTPCTKGGCQRS